MRPDELSRVETMVLDWQHARAAWIADHPDTPYPNEEHVQDMEIFLAETKAEAAHMKAVPYLPVRTVTGLPRREMRLLTSIDAKLEVQNAILSDIATTLEAIRKTHAEQPAKPQPMTLADFEAAIRDLHIDGRAVRRLLGNMSAAQYGKMFGLTYEQTLDDLRKRLVEDQQPA